MARTRTRAPDSSRRARETQRRLIRSSGSARAHIALTVVLGLVTTVLIIAQATLLAIVIAGVFMDGDSPSDVAGLLVWLAVIAVARGLVSAAFESSGRFGAARVMSELRRKLSERLLLVNPGTAREEHSGELVASAVDGVEALEAYFARYLPQVVLAATVPIAILIWVFPYDWKAGLILAITAPLIPVFMVLIGMLTEGRTRRRWSMLSRLSSHFLDLVAGLQTLRAYGRADAQAESIAAVGESYRRETMGALRVGFLSSLVLELLAMTGVALVAATIGIQLASGTLQLEAGLTVLLLAPEMYMPLRQLGNQFHASADGMVAAEDIFKVLDRPADVETPLDPVPAPSPGERGLDIEGLELVFAGRGKVLDDLELSIAPGETVGLVGPSGGGKTTLVSLILRLARPGAGRISCGGVDLDTIDPREWRRHLVWVPQRPTLFAGSLAWNLRLFEPDADEAALRRAVSDAGLEDLVTGLPEGLETPVGDGGRRLSVGQAQRVALARALISRAPMVLLDEPTAHLDSESEETVARAIARLTEGRTALLVSHRLRAIAGADRVLELRDGRLAPFEPDLQGGIGMIAARLARSPLGRIVLATRGRWRRFLLSALLAAVTILAAVGLLTVSGYLISRAAEQPDILSLTAVIVWIRILGFSRALFRYAERLVSHDLAFRSLADLRRRFFERLVPLVPGGLDQPASADLLSRFVGDVDRLQDLYLRALTPPVVAVFTGLVCVGVAALILPAAALVLAVMLLFGGIAAPALTRWAAKVSGRRQARARAALSGSLLEVTTGSAEIAVAGREEDWLQRTASADRRVLRLQKRDALNGGISEGLVTMLAAGAGVAVTAVAVPAVDEGVISGVLLAALALLAIGSFEAVMPLGPAAASLDSCADAAGRIEEITERPAPVVEPEEPLPTPESGPLCFEQVRFSYGPGLPVVLDLADFRVSPGEAVALVGPSGAGKSTIAELMVRFRDPDEGRVTLGGVDLRALDSDRVREAVRLAPQDSYLFTGTLGENVALGMPTASDGQVAGALELVGLGPWLEGLEDGLETFVGEGGSMVSGGQRQRIAAARCLLGGARFMVFDEPTAHLDPAGALSLETALVKGRGSGAGVFVITHAIADPANFDRVLELDGSHAVGEKTWAQLD